MIVLCMVQLDLPTLTHTESRSTPVFGSFQDLSH